MKKPRQFSPVNSTAHAQSAWNLNLGCVKAERPRKGAYASKRVVRERTCLREGGGRPFIAGQCTAVQYAMDLPRSTGHNEYFLGESYPYSICVVLVYEVRTH